MMCGVSIYVEVLTPLATSGLVVDAFETRVVTVAFSSFRASRAPSQGHARRFASPVTGWCSPEIPGR